MLLATTIFVLIQCLLALVSPPRFIYFSLWTQTIPYTWNFDVQNVYDTPVGPLAIVALQLFGFCFACSLIVVTHFEAVASQLRNFKWHALFVLFCIVSLVYAPSAVYGLRMIAKLVGPPLFMIVTLAVIKTEAELQRMRNALLMTGAVLVALALYARAVGIVVDPNAAQTGIAGLGPPGMGPPVFSAHMLPVTMLAVALFVCRPRPGPFVWSLFGILSIIAALQRTSAGAMYAGISLILFLGTRGIWRIVLPSIGICGLPALLLFSDTFRRRMFYTDVDTSQLLADPSKVLASVNTSGRSDLWTNMLARFFEPNPVVGSGIGATQDYLAKHAAGAVVVHSEYVRLLCEVGLVGLLLYVLAMGSYLWRFRRYASKSNEPALRSAGLAAAGSLLTYLVYCTTDNAFDYVTQFGIYVFALMAIAEKTQQFATVEKQMPVPLAAAQSNSFPNLLR